jgi:hypothetical protein
MERTDDVDAVALPARQTNNAVAKSGLILLYQFVCREDWKLAISIATVSSAK